MEDHYYNLLFDVPFPLHFSIETPFFLYLAQSGYSLICCSPVLLFHFSLLQTRFYPVYSPFEEGKPQFTSLSFIHLQEFHLSVPLLSPTVMKLTLV